MKNADILAQEIAEADAILIGGGSGLSSACGYNHYHWSPYFDEELKAFRAYYHFKSPFDGFYYVYSDYGAQWGYYASYILSMLEAPIGQAYSDLAALVADKPHFVLSTNIDGQFERVFENEKICSFQGDFSYLQCSQPCEDHIESALPRVREMVNAIDQNLRVPAELVPRCEQCGRVMVPWVRDDTFLEGKAWQSGFQRYRDFVGSWLKNGKRLLLLELGVGDMTPSIIKLPFWELAHRNENVRLVRVNRDVESVPAHIGNKAIYIHEDITEILAHTRQRKES